MCPASGRASRPMRPARPHPLVHIPRQQRLGHARVLRRIQQGLRHRHQQRSQVPVTGLRDTAQAFRLAPRAVLPRHHPQPGGELAPTPGLVLIADHRDQRGGRGLADPGQTHQLPCALRRTPGGHGARTTALARPRSSPARGACSGAAKTFLARSMPTSKIPTGFPFWMN